jgi:hypothetical protein
VEALGKPVESDQRRKRRFAAIAAPLAKPIFQRLSRLKSIPPRTCELSGDTANIGIQKPFLFVKD